MCFLSGNALAVHDIEVALSALARLDLSSGHPVNTAIAITARDQRGVPRRRHPRRVETAS